VRRWAPLLSDYLYFVQGKVPFISLGVLHDLHHLIFILAVVHVITCTVTVLLGEVQVKSLSNISLRSC